MNTQKHTSGKWEAWKDGSVIAKFKTGQSCKVAESNDLFLIDGTAEANAQFIVKACNNHYQLLEACKKVSEQLERYTDIEGLCLSRRLLKDTIAHVESK